MHLSNYFNNAASLLRAHIPLSGGGGYGNGDPSMPVGCIVWLVIGVFALMALVSLFF